MIDGFGLSDPKLGKYDTFLGVPKFLMTSAINMILRVVGAILNMAYCSRWIREAQYVGNHSSHNPCVEHYFNVILNLLTSAVSFTNLSPLLASIPFTKPYHLLTFTFFTNKIWHCIITIYQFSLFYQIEGRFNRIHCYCQPFLKRHILKHTYKLNTIATHKTHQATEFGS